MLASDQVVKFPAAAKLQDIKRQGLKNYYRDSHWGQALELLSHLCLYGHQHILVIGAPGIGKTTMKQALEKRCIPNLYIVDDADNLPRDQIARLLEEPSQKVVLFAKQQLLDHVRRATIGWELRDKLRIIEIEPMAQKEIKGFLQHLWLAAGNEGVVACNKENIRRIFALTKGNPGSIKTVFSKQMFANLLRGQSMTEEQKPSRSLSPFTVGLVAAFGLGFCLLALMWPVSKVAPEVQNLPTPQTLVAEVPIMSAVEPEFDSVYTVDDEQDKKLFELEQKMLSLQDKILQSQQKAVDVSFVDVETEVEPIAPKVAVTLAPSGPKKVAKKTTKANKNVANPNVKRSLSKDEHAILNKDKKRYTLQLVASSNEQRIKDFIRDNKLAPQAKYYTGKRKGKPWYTVVYGDFADKKAAMAGAKNLPEAVKKLEPWARQYIHIQDTINKSHL